MKTFQKHSTHFCHLKPSNSLAALKGSFLKTFNFSSLLPMQFHPLCNRSCVQMASFRKEISSRNPGSISPMFYCWVTYWYIRGWIRGTPKLRDSTRAQDVRHICYNVTCTNRKNLRNSRRMVFLKIWWHRVLTLFLEEWFISIGTWDWSFCSVIWHQNDEELVTQMKMFWHLACNLRFFFPLHRLRDR